MHDMASRKIFPAFTPTILQENLILIRLISGDFIYLNGQFLIFLTYDIYFKAQPTAVYSSWRTIRLRNELKSLHSDPPEGIEAVPLDEMCYQWQASITGPKDSPYEGGTFFLYLQIPPG